jgi:hypothetical protein
VVNLNLDPRDEIAKLPTHKVLPVAIDEIVAEDEHTSAIVRRVAAIIAEGQGVRS